MRFCQSHLCSWPMNWGLRHNPPSWIRNGGFRRAGPVQRRPNASDGSPPVREFIPIETAAFGGVSLSFSGLLDWPSPTARPRKRRKQVPRVGRRAKELPTERNGRNAIEAGEVLIGNRDTDLFAQIRVVLACCVSGDWLTRSSWWAMESAFIADSDAFRSFAKRNPARAFVFDRVRPPVKIGTTAGFHEPLMG